MHGSTALSSWAYILIFTPAFLAIVLGLSASVAWMGNLADKRSAPKLALTHRPGWRRTVLHG